MHPHPAVLAAIISPPIARAAHCYNVTLTETDFKVQSSTDFTTWTDVTTSGSSGIPGTVFTSGSDYISPLPTKAAKTFLHILVNPN